MIADWRARCATTGTPPVNRLFRHGEFYKEMVPHDYSRTPLILTPVRLDAVLVMEPARNRRRDDVQQFRNWLICAA